MRQKTQWEPDKIDSIDEKIDLYEEITFSILDKISSQE